MLYFKVSYTNYNFIRRNIGVYADTPENAIEMAREYEGNRQVIEVSAREIPQDEFLLFPDTAYKNENIRF